MADESIPNPQTPASMQKKFKFMEKLFEKETKEYPTIPIDDRVKNPLFYINYHTTLQGAKLGVFLGVVVSLFRKQQPDKIKMMLYGLYGGMAISAPASIQKMIVMTREGIEDRAFRIKHNKPVQNSDMIFWLGGLSGFCVGSVIAPWKKNSKVRFPIKYGLMGASLGFLSKLVFVGMQKNWQNKK